MTRVLSAIGIVLVFWLFTGGLLALALVQPALALVAVVIIVSVVVFLSAKDVWFS